MPSSTSAALSMVFCVDTVYLDPSVAAADTALLEYTQPSLVTSRLMYRGQPSLPLHVMFHL